MIINDEELKEIYVNAPIEKSTFEVLTLKATWFSQDYYLQNAFNENIEITLETSEVVTALYAPFESGEGENNEELNYEKNVILQNINDLIAKETENFNPDLPEDERLPKLESRVFKVYRDGTYEIANVAPIRVDTKNMTRDEFGVTINATTKPVNSQATGETATVNRVPMLRAFL